MGVIYKIEHKVNHMIYIGQTYRTFNERLAEHLKTKRNYHVDNALRKYGVQNFYLDVLEEVEDNLLDERERYWIEFYDCVSPKGYNNTYGGEGGKMSEHTKQKISNSLKGRFVGELNPMFGKPSPMRGKVGAMRGKKHKQETIQKMKVSRTGENSKSAKPIILVETGNYFISAKHAEDITGIKRSCLCCALKGTQEIAGGWHWRYATKYEIENCEDLFFVIP